MQALNVSKANLLDCNVFILSLSQLCDVHLTVKHKELICDFFVNFKLSFVAPVGINFVWIVLIVLDCHNSSSIACEDWSWFEVPLIFFLSEFKDDDEDEIGSRAHFFFHKEVPVAVALDHVYLTHFTFFIIYSTKFTCILNTISLREKD